MANEVLLKQGTAKVWTSAGGDYALDCNTLATVSARQGAKGDLGATRARAYSVIAEIKTGSVAPVAGKLIDIYWSASQSGTAATGNMAGCSGSDAAYTGYSSNLADSLQDLIYIGSLVLTALANQVHRQVVATIFIAPTRYGMPVVYNASLQSLSTTGTDHRIELVPLIDEIQ